MDDQVLYTCEVCPEQCEYDECDLMGAEFYDDPSEDATCPCCGDLAVPEEPL